MVTDFHTLEDLIKQREEYIARIRKEYDEKIQNVARLRPHRQFDPVLSLFGENW